MKKIFAKLFETEEFGQILVKIDSSEEDNYEAEVRIYFEPGGFGVCSSAFSFDSWDDAEEAFDKVHEDVVVSVVQPLTEHFSGIFKNE